MADKYPRGLAWSLRHRAIVIVGAIVSVVIAFIIIPRLGFTWLPDYDGGEFNVSFRTAPGSSLDFTESKGKAISEFLRTLPETQFTYLNVGGGFRGTPSNGNIYVRLSPKSQRKRSQTDIQNLIRAQLRKIPDVRAAILGTPSIFGGYRQPIQIYVQGPEPARLKLVAAKVIDIMRSVPGAAEPTSSDEGDMPELEVNVNRQEAWAAGVGVGSIGATLQPLFQGQRATTWEDPQGYSHDVDVVYPDSLRVTPDQVANIPLSSTNLSPNGVAAIVPLSQVASVQTGVGPQQIDRASLERQITLSAGVLPGFAMGDVADRVQAAADSAGMPPGYRLVFKGDVQNLRETKGYVTAALTLAIVFIYLILASLFESFVQPLSIMVALPLSLLGVALALLITGGNLNVMTMIGMIMLMGLVTKNGILLIDFTNQLRAGGQERTEALIHAGRVRLRPILMTTTAMIAGMIPLALAIGQGSEQRAPMARAVIGGLITSTILTLVVVPVVYTLIDDLGQMVKRGAHLHAADEPEEAPPFPATATARDALPGGGPLVEGAD